MSLRAEQILSSKVSFTIAALLVMFTTSPILARVHDAQSQSTAPPKASSPHRTAQIASGAQKTFSSPQEAAQALYDMARNHDEKAMLAILGPGARDIVIWTDNQAERYAQDDVFAKKYEQMHRFVNEPDNETTLYVGAENWPLPLPLVAHNGAWFFDSNLGRREILFRRIGENEMDAIDALRGIIAAEYQFNAEAGEYAQHLNCSQGQHDGLFSPENGNDMDKNPLGPYVAEASYTRSDRMPFHGYYFLILTAQGRHAHGGARSYIVDGKMTGGFAVVAFPAAYRSSGVKTFIVNQYGMIHEKDLGPKTTEIASAMKAYDHDGTWAHVRPSQFLTVSSPNP
ncbi:MAG TPA: DUF2950 family protein [Terriglobales bacterium]|nr:DUF2950 family protein [Terriglobales bacterium]